MNTEFETQLAGKLAWVEPKVVQLDVNETAGVPGPGGDTGHGVDNLAS